MVLLLWREPQPKLLFQYDVFCLSVGKGVFLHLVALDDGYIELLAVAHHFDAEVGTECTDVVKLHVVPCRGEVGCECERVEAGWANAKQALGDDASVETALG